jgi:hypothetical protein
MVLDPAPSGEQVEQEHHHGHYEQEMDETAGHMEYRPPKDPGDEQDNSEPQHGEASGRVNKIAR